MRSIKTRRCYCSGRRRLEDLGAHLTLCVCSFEEGGRRKCGQYWPLEKDSQLQFGVLTVTNLGVENMNHYKKTTLEIHSTEVKLGLCPEMETCPLLGG